MAITKNKTRYGATERDWDNLVTAGLMEDLLPVGFFLVQFVVVADEGDGKDAARHQQREPMAAQGVEHPCRCRAAYHRLSWVGVSGGSVGETPSAYPLTGDAGRS